MDGTTMRSLLARPLAPLLATALLICAPAAGAQPAPAYPVGGNTPASTATAPAAQPGSAVPPAIQEVRRQMLKAEANAFYFHSMEQLFDTRVVGRSGSVWELPRVDRRPDIRYDFAGAGHGFDEFLDRTFTNALLVIKDGRIVTEVYRNRTDAQTRFMSWSMAKSITSTLVGLAVADKRIRSLDDRIDAYLPELKGGGYEGVTIAQVLTMRSGVDYEERYDGKPGVASDNHEYALIQNVRRFADAARTLKRTHKPGEVFQYKTIDTAVLGWLVERVTDRPVAEYMTQRIWEPLGAERDGFFILDGPPAVGREFTGAGFNATLRDFGRFGQMILDGGKANGRQIVPAAWIAEATKPAGAEDDRGGYGYQWWTVPQSSAFYALGLQGQFIYVDPSTRTVIVKLSYFPPEQNEIYGEALAGLAALSAWRPAP